jgi:acetyl esterase/lipase
MKIMKWLRFLVLAPTLLTAGCSGDDPASVPVDYLEPRFEIAESIGIVYGTSFAPDGSEVDLLLDLYEPVGEEVEASPPAFVLVHGGGFRGGTRSNDNLVRIARDLAARGYLTISIDYRLLRDTGPAEIPDRYAGLAALPWFIAAPVEDTWKSVEWLYDNTLADRERTFILGSSAGGVDAMTIAYSPDDLGVAEPLRFAGVVGLWGFLLTPDHLGPGDAPVFIVHGQEDRTVDWELSKLVADRAEAAGVAYEFYAPEEAGHGFDQSGFFEDGPQEGVTYYDRMLRFANDLATD